MSTKLDWTRDLSPGIHGDFYRATVNKMVVRVATIGVAALWRGEPVALQWSVVDEDSVTNRPIVLASGYAVDEQQAFRLCEAVVDQLGII